LLPLVVNKDVHDTVQQQGWL